MTAPTAAFHLVESSKKGFSAHQLHRELGCQYNTARFLHHRVIEAMRRGGLDLPPMGGEGIVVEADETYFGSVDNPKVRTTTTRGYPFTKHGHTGPSNKRPAVALVEPGGNVRTFHVPVADQVTVQNIIKAKIARETRLHTDESRLYFGIGKHLTHKTVKYNAGEYVRASCTHFSNIPTALRHVRYQG
jgi:hypothetical protein